MTSQHYTPVFDSIRGSSRLAKLPEHLHRLFYLMLLPQCDAWGRHDGRPEMVLASVWPLLGLSPSDTGRAMEECAKVGLIEIHRDGEHVWIQIPDWEEKAGSVGKRDHRRKSAFPAPSSATLEGNGPAMARDWPGDGPARPSRARKPQPQPQPQPQIQRSADCAADPGETAVDQPSPAPELDPPPQPRSPTRRGGTDATRLWDRLWREHRGSDFAWIQADAVAMARCLKLAGAGGLAEVEARAVRLLTSTERFLAEGASPRLLVNRWNQLSVQFVQRPPGSGDSPSAQLALAALRAIR